MCHRGAPRGELERMCGRGNVGIFKHGRRAMHPVGAQT